MLFTSPKPTRLLRRFSLLFTLCNGTVLLVCFFLGLLLQGQPFILLHDRQILWMMALSGTALAAVLFLLDRGLSLLETIFLRRAGNNLPIVLVIVGLGTIGLAGCEIKTTDSAQVKSVVQGSGTNPATGMRTVYRNMESQTVKMVMNDEVLGHADIPLGEKFYIINEGVRGLQTKDGKVSVGCSLQITDEKGKLLMNEADLFAGNDIFKKEEATFLRCAVSTGRPMESEYYYTVKASFWDKYGDGFIENEVKIRVIDMP